MVLNQRLMFLVRDFLWVAFCCAVLVSFVLLFMEERGKREEDESDAAGDDRSGSELEKSGGGVGSSEVAALVKSGEERCDLGGLGFVGGVGVDDERDVFDESPERGCGLDAEGVRVSEPGEGGVEEKNMDDGNGGELEVISGSFGAGGDDGLDMGVEVLEMSGSGEGDGVGGGARDDFGFEEKKLVEDNGDVVEAEVLDGRQVRASSRMEAWVAGAVRALERYERVDGEGDGVMNGNIFDGENISSVEDDAESISSVEDDTEMKMAIEDEFDEKKRLVEDENERVIQDKNGMKGLDEDDNQGLVEDDEKNRLVEDDHGNKQLTELEDCEDDDDDWEGIERTELEKRFGAAVAYIGRNESEECLSKLSSSVKMQLYGLHQVATRGPCTNPQPRIFQVSARANWNAWRQVGDMSPEEAMEKYMALLSENVDNWTEDDIDGTSMN